MVQAQVESGEHAQHERDVTIRIDNRPYHLTEREMTGAALKVVGGVPRDYQLFEEVPGPGPDRGIRDEEIVKLHDGLKFYGVVAGTLG